MIAHELVHELQRLANTAYDAEYEEARAIYGAGPDNPFETFPNALENAADIAKVQEWLGHANVSSTRL